MILVVKTFSNDLYWSVRIDPMCANLEILAPSVSLKSMASNKKLLAVKHAAIRPVLTQECTTVECNGQEEADIPILLLKVIHKYIYM